MFASKRIQSALGTGCAAFLAAASLSGCVVSDNPHVNAAATGAAVGSVAGLLFYSLSDGYYYDNDYRRLPRDYRPGPNVRIQRINSMDEYRRQHPRSGMTQLRQRHAPDMRRHDGRNGPQGQMQPRQRQQWPQYNDGRVGRTAQEVRNSRSNSQSRPQWEYRPNSDYRR